MTAGKQSQPVAATPQQQQSTVPQTIVPMQGKSQQQQATSDGNFVYDFANK